MLVHKRPSDRFLLYGRDARQRLSAPESNFIIQQKQITFREKVVLYLEKVRGIVKKKFELWPMNLLQANEKRKFSLFMYPG